MEIKAFRWYGGKIRIVQILNDLIPEHAAYYEPFMGSAALLLNHPRSELEVINDLDEELVFFMKTLADDEKGKELIRRLEKLWYGKSFFDEALEASKRQYRGLDDIEKAVKIYTLITQSFNCTRKSFSPGAFRNTSDYRADISFHLPEVHERLQGVRILQMNGIDLLGKIADNPNAFAFVDPPYRWELRGAGADRAYACEMPQYEHVRLLKTVRNAKCKVMLCGYRSETEEDLYDIYLKPYGWKCYKIGDYVKSCQVKKKHRDMGQEFIWVNYELPVVAKYVISMEEY